MSDETAVCNSQSTDFKFFKYLKMKLKCKFVKYMHFDPVGSIKSCNEYLKN